MCENALVEFLLHGREICADDELGFCGDVLEDVGLHASEHVGAEQVVQLVDLSEIQKSSYDFLRFA